MIRIKTILFKVENKLFACKISLCYFLVPYIHGFLGKTVGTFVLSERYKGLPVQLCSPDTKGLGMFSESI
jgi:hypothetical protein